jgi:hypothetical protein
MTPGDNGASTPEDDDPFGYLYADGQAKGAQPPSGGYGYPNSVSRVRTVGERQYGQQAGGQSPTASYAQTAQQPADAFSPNPSYQAPETLSGGAPAGPRRPHAGGGGRGRGGGPNNKGLLIGAVAVVAAVVIGISVAMLGDDGSDTAGNDSSPSASAPQETQQQTTAPAGQDDGDKQKKLPEADAKALALAGGATTASDVPGAKADGGVYVTGLNQVGSSVTWTVNGIKTPGGYRLNVNYGIPGKDADATLTVNGNAQSRPLNMKNFGGSPAGDWSKGWQSTWANLQLTKGTNVIKISCEQGNACDFALDQIWLSKG